MSAARSAGLPAPRADVALMNGYHSPQLDVDVRLNTNEAPEPPPARFVEALREELGRLAWNRYPDRSAKALRAAIATYHGVSPEEVFCANGSNEVLQSLLLAYGGPGRSVVVFEPTYALHSHIARVTGTQVVTGERDEDFLLDSREVARCFAQAAGAAGGPNPVITFLCSPNNPTGRLEPDERVDDVCRRAPGLVVIDEAYGQFAPRSALWRRNDDARVVIIRTFSKTWSLAGLRLGYALGAPEVVGAMERVVLPYHLNLVTQAAGVIALAHEDEMRARVDRLVAERTRVVAGLSTLGCQVVPSDANFVLFAPPGGDAHGIWSALVARSVLVRDLSGWPRLADYLRVTIGAADENDRFLAALSAALVERGAG